MVPAYDRYGKIDGNGLTILDELRWRGLIAQTTDLDALAEATRPPLTVYAGFDPTAPSLHAGNLVTLLSLRRFQLFGPSTDRAGRRRDWADRRSSRRRGAGTEHRRHRRRLGGSHPRPARAVRRLRRLAVRRGRREQPVWTAPLSAIDFLRDVGKHFSVNVMLERDTVKRRLEGEGISYTEFSYMLLQANDYLQLHQRYGCSLQIGGSDQWGNIVAGVRLVRQKLGAHRACV